MCVGSGRSTGERRRQEAQVRDLHAFAHREQQRQEEREQLEQTQLPRALGFARQRALGDLAVRAQPRHQLLVVLALQLRLGERQRLADLEAGVEHVRVARAEPRARRRRRARRRHLLATSRVRPQVSSTVTHSGTEERTFFSAEVVEVVDSASGVCAGDGTSGT